MAEVERIDKHQRVLRRTQQESSRHWAAPLFIALTIVTLLLMGLSMYIQATVDAVNGGL